MLVEKLAGHLKWGIAGVERLSRIIGRFFCNSPHRILAYLVNGLIILIPLIVTLWILIWTFNLIDGILSPALKLIFGRSVPGLGFAIILISIILIGYLGVKFGRRKAFDFFESNVIKIPVVGTIYGGVRQILESFTSSSSNKFLEVIFMEFPRNGIYTIGLVTGQVEDRNGKKILNVFIPTAPNPTSGFLQIVPESDVVKTSMSVNDAMKLIISAGKVSHKDIADMLTQFPKRETNVRS